MGNLRSIVESIGAGVMLTDRDLRVIVVNREVLNIHGLTEEDLVGRPVTETVGTALEMEVYRQWLAGEHTDPARYTRSLVDASGRHRLFSLTASPILDSSGVVRQIAFLGVDETERREAEHALFAAERLTTVGEMAATVAHELSQPLQVIDLACHTARDELSEATERGSAVDPDFMATKLDRIAHQVERASRIVGDLRAFVRGAGAGDDPVPFQIAEAVRGAVDLTTHGLRQQQTTLSASLPDGLPPVIGHVGRLEQVLVNLINNARDAGGHTISVAASAVERRRPAAGAHRGRGFRARASRPTCCRACSWPSSPPRRAARAPGLACASAGASSRRWTARSRPATGPRVAPASKSSCRRRSCRTRRCDLALILEPVLSERNASSDCNFWLIVSLAEGGVNSRARSCDWEASMEEAVAGRMMEAALATGNEIGKLDSIVSELENGREKEELVRALGNIMSVLTRDVVFRIVRDHPELDPDR